MQRNKTSKDHRKLVLQLKETKLTREDLVSLIQAVKTSVLMDQGKKRRTKRRGLNQCPCRTPGGRRCQAVRGDPKQWDVIFLWHVEEPQERRSKLLRHADQWLTDSLSVGSTRLTASSWARHLEAEYSSYVGPLDAFKSFLMVFSFS